MYKYNKNRWFLALLAMCAISAMGQQQTVNIDVKSHGADISKSMYGVFFEEINHAGDGGLYAELVQNRNFMEKEMLPGYHVEGNNIAHPEIANHLTGEKKKRLHPWNPAPVPGWRLSDSIAATMVVTKEKPKFPTAPTNLKVTTTKPVTLINEGYWGMGIQKGEQYKLRTIIRAVRTSGDSVHTANVPDGVLTGNVSDGVSVSSGEPCTITANIVNEKGKSIASTPIIIKGDSWNDTTIIITANASCATATLQLLIPEGTTWFDYVSLFPLHTFNNQENGLRKDVAEVLLGLRPAFFRWPGGCVVEGITLDNRYEWKNTLGDPAARPGQYSLWGYRCSYGMGYKEILDFCEATKMDLMFVCNVGMNCQMRIGSVCHADSVSFFIKDCLDALDYALGDANTEWGAKRIADGHPQPYPLKYVEVGNENWGPVYQERYLRFRDAIKARYPQLSIIYNVMWKKENNIPCQADFNDYHFYKDPAFFFTSTRMFDKWDRSGARAYCGEYACNGNVGSGNMYAALSEAAFIGGMERNGDLVQMASYAPLFENSNNRRWRTNLIWINSSQCIGRSSYWVQRMCAENRPDYNLVTDFMPRETKESSNSRISSTSRTSSDSLECPLQFIDAGYDKASCEIVIKVVNATKDIWSPLLKLNNAEFVSPTGKVITLSAKSGNDENSFEDPTKISPKVSIYKKFSRQFTYAFQPFSYTILRIKSK